jgi:predicted transcriptional regulator
MKQSFISLIFLSDRRKDLLSLLKEGPRDIDKIKELLRVDSSSIQPHIKKMKESGLICEKNKIYSLSEIGKSIAENMQPMLNITEFFEENTEYWKTHDLSSIPRFLLERIDELGHCELLEPDSEHLTETPKILLENILNSKEIFTFTSYSHPEAPSIYSGLAEKGIEINLCMTENVIERLFSSYRKEADKLLKNKNSKLFILHKKAEIPSLIVSDSFLAFKLFETDGKLRDQIIMCFGKKASCWGKELFQYYIKTAAPLNANDFLRTIEL